MLISTGSNSVKVVEEIFLGSTQAGIYFPPTKSPSSLCNHHPSLGGVCREGLSGEVLQNENIRTFRVKKDYSWCHIITGGP